MFQTLIYIGRFQPPHNGHFATIRKALEQTDALLIFVGSHEACRSLRNPFSTQERIEMLKVSLTKEELKKITFIPIHDSNYNHVEWVRTCKDKACLLSAEPAEFAPIGIIGYKKDDTSYYLELFPEWKFVEMPLLENGLSSTEIRNKWLGGVLTKQDKIPPELYGYLKDKESEEWAKLQMEEYKLVQEYKKEWSCTPYPPIFVAGDALVLCNEHILLIKRGAFPGKGLYAMAGGFLDSNELIRDCAIRELMEETGIELSYKALSNSIKDCQVFDEPTREPRGRMISHTFLFDLKNPLFPKLKAADDASEAIWFPLKDLDKIRSQLGGDHYKIIKKMLSCRNF